MRNVTHSIFKTFLLSVLVIAQMHFAYAQTASILPPAKTTFFDANGNPLTSGTVESFIPSTTTHKTTWQDAAETIPNSNPLTLDAAGRALLLGSGSYRQVVKDRNSNVIWDQVTSSTGSGGGSGSTATGDGDLVGTIKPWAGMTAPNQYVFTYGQELSRTTFSALFTAITSTQSIFCNSGSPILNGLSDTTNFWIGMTVELSCVAPGFSTIISKTATTVTLALNSNVTTGTNAIFFPWGRGNGSTTFNIPDFRGFVLAGNDNMGGVAANNLTVPFYATDPNSIGAAGGGQSHAITNAEIASHNHPVFLNDPGHIHTASGSIIPGAGGSIANGPNLAISGIAINSAVTGITIRNTTGLFGTTNQTSSSNGGIAISATLGNTGSGYTNGSQTITVAGGTCSTQPQFTITIAGNIFTGTPALLTAGSCTIAPTNPAATTGGGGTGGTLDVSYSAQPISIIQPTKTSNYIIKVTPDANSATASGVTALGGMTGSIACGSGLLCTGNNISSTISFPVSIGLGGTGQTTAPTAITALMPTPTRTGDVVYWNGSIWTTLAGNNSGSQVFTENSSGLPSWTTPGLGTVTSATIAAGTGISVTGTCAITTTGTCTVNSLSSVLLNTLTCPNSGLTACVDTTSLTGAYSLYEIVFEDVLPATNNVTAELQVHSGGSFQATSYIGNSTGFSNGSSTAIVAAPTTFVQLGNAGSIQNTVSGFAGSMRIANPAGTSLKKLVYGTNHYTGSTLTGSAMNSGYWNGGNGAIDGFQVLFSSGNITSGVIKIYGIQ